MLRSWFRISLGFSKMKIFKIFSGSHLSPRCCIIFAIYPYNINKTLFQMKKQNINFRKWEHNISISVRFVLRAISTPSLSEIVFLLFQWRDNFWCNFNCLSNCCFNFHHNEEMKWCWIFCSLVNWIHISKRKVRSQTIHVSLYWIFLLIFHTTSLWCLYAVDFFLSLTDWENKQINKLT